MISKNSIVAALILAVASIVTLTPPAAAQLDPVETETAAPDEDCAKALAACMEQCKKNRDSDNETFNRVSKWARGAGLPTGDKSIFVTKLSAILDYIDEDCVKQCQENHDCGD